MTRTKDRRPIRERLLERFPDDGDFMHFLASKHPEINTYPILCIVCGNDERVHNILDRMEGGTQL